MKIALVADVHGNLPALEAVIADLERVKPDLVVHGGDLVLNGPHPAEVLDRVRELGWPGVLGNTDEALWKEPEGRPHFRAPIAATTRLLGKDRVGWLRRLPLEWRRSAELALVHAVPGDLWKGIRPDADERLLLDIYGPLGAGLAVYCHIHRGFVRRLDGLTVANTGSAGMPWDGDWRASYLVVSDGRCEHRRVVYDLERELAGLRSTGYPNWEDLAEGRRQGTPPAFLRS
ncbi:MAG TPA: metallophosphoesterase family protein [Candidatus Acidoferrales bacterium]|nr:metallophosphoesterase family protein [Candidatus Acidoferrales bacterium]